MLILQAAQKEAALRKSPQRQRRPMMPTIGSCSPQSPVGTRPMLPAARRNWLRALEKIKALKDPWEKYHLEKRPTENALRYRYNSLKKKWVTDKVIVKMEDQVNHFIVPYQC